MKKKIGELYDKPIVIGNPNEFTKNEIPLKSLGESFDDGMEYYKIDTKFLEIAGDVQNVLSQFFITSISGGKLKPGVVLRIGEVMYACGNAKIVLYADVTAKNQLNIELEKYGISLNDTSIFKPITAKEYYSLLN